MTDPNEALVAFLFKIFLYPSYWKINRKCEHARKQSPLPPAWVVRGWGEGGLVARAQSETVRLLYHPLHPRPLSPQEGGEGRSSYAAKATFP